MQSLREIADENDIILIYDEVQTGVGVTGKMWAHQHFCMPECDNRCLVNCKAIEPDIISFGKKTQCCGIFAGNRLNEVDNHVFQESSRINSTFGGNLVDMVRFTIYLELIEKEDLVSAASVNGDYLLSCISDLQQKHNNLMSNARGKGLFCAFDLPTPEQRDKFITIMEELGVLILGCGHRSIRFRPHLNVKKGDIDIGISMISNALSQL